MPMSSTVRRKVTMRDRPWLTLRRATKVPLPCLRKSRPSWIIPAMACRTVMRLMRCSRQSSRSEGIASPGR